MELIRDPDNFSQDQRRCVATIGNFDGIHHGHRAVIAQLKEIAKRHDLPTLVVIFEPQPQEYFMLDNVPARLTCLREKLVELNKLGIDFLVCLRFNEQLANLSAQAFVQKFLVDALHVKALLVGDDFRFGKQRQGDYALLQSLGKGSDYILHSADTCLFREAKISSTRIRQALRDDELELARQLLGRAYTMSGRVIDGDKIGRTLGFPTANIALRRSRSPLSGIYVTRVYIAPSRGRSGSTHQAVTSIGTRPMFSGSELRLETHILDFNETIYAQYIQIEFLKKLRLEKKFKEIDDMTKQIRIDIEKVRQYFAMKNPNTAGILHTD